MKKYALLLLLCCLNFWAVGQKKTTPTDLLTITGLVKKEVKIAIADLEKLNATPIEDMPIVSHKGESKHTLKNMKGVLLKDILSNIEFDAEYPKVLSEFFLTLEAEDGYKVVFSWNELFNSPTGDHTYLVTEKEGEKLATMKERLLVITTTDFKTGRRHIKSLSKITVGRVK